MDASWSVTLTLLVAPVANTTAKNGTPTRRSLQARRRNSSQTFANMVAKHIATHKNKMNVEGGNNIAAEHTAANAKHHRTQSSEESTDKG